MAQHYSDPKRESDPQALPDIETFYVDKRAFWAHCSKCSYAGKMPRDRETRDYHSREHFGWYWRFLPDGEPNGPFASEREAVEDAQSASDDDGGESDTEVLYADDERGSAISDGEGGSLGAGWYWRKSKPLSLYHGPFATESEADADARQASGSDDDELPPCVQAMRCYCAGHARGNPASAPCDTTE